MLVMVMLVMVVMTVVVMLEQTGSPQSSCVLEQTLGSQTSCVLQHSYLPCVLEHSYSLRARTNGFRIRICMFPQLLRARTNG